MPGRRLSCFVFKAGKDAFNSRAWNFLPRWMSCNALPAEIVIPLKLRNNAFTANAFTAAGGRTHWHCALIAQIHFMADDKDTISC